MKDKYESEAMQVIHEDMKGMRQLGIIDDARMKEFDKMCLAQKDETIKAASSVEVEHATA
jgi:DNA-binding transcriptional regulator YiaG